MEGLPILFFCTNISDNQCIINSFFSVSYKSELRQKLQSICLCALTNKINKNKKKRIEN